MLVHDAKVPDWDSRLKCENDGRIIAGSHECGAIAVPVHDARYLQDLSDALVRLREDRD
jgi:hypothetical protein